MSKEKSEAQSIPTVVILVSSAKKIILVFPATFTFGRSLMKRRNKSGPSTEPCGTAQFTGFISEVFDPILMY